MPSEALFGEWAAFAEQSIDQHRPVQLREVGHPGGIEFTLLVDPAKDLVAEVLREVVAIRPVAERLGIEVEDVGGRTSIGGIDLDVRIGRW